MTKQKNKIISKYPISRRKTFKKHSRRYAKVYSPYLPAIAALTLGLSLLAPFHKPNVAVLSYSSATSPNGLLSETNNRRESSGDKPLGINGLLTAAAQTKADDMASRNYWSHITPDGEQPWYFISRAGYSYSEAAENLAYGFTSSKDTVSGWMNSPEHKSAMLNKDYSEVGFGIAKAANYQDHGPETIVVALYAKPSSEGLARVKSTITDTPASGISRGQLLTAGDSPWINLILGTAIGIIIMYLFTKHSLKLRKKIRKGERYILHHPLLDMTLLSVLVLLLALSRTSGFIK